MEGGAVTSAPPLLPPPSATASSTKRAEFIEKRLEPCFSHATQGVQAPPQQSSRQRCWLALFEEHCQVWQYRLPLLGAVQAHTARSCASQLSWREVHFWQ
mmetsp:Transcript_45935/g.143938  ORF Transcript_45935/g.143938 Transcript_45935/m.143938 type:complete len:100 (+) Transcript_45935:1046-1345(+)